MPATPSASPPATAAGSRIPSEDRIPLRQKIAFAFGVNMDIFAMSLTLNALWLPVFNIGLGIPPLVLSVILVVLRIWDAFTDPIMGNISDNARTPWGRRRPFIFLGALLVVLVYPLFWRLPAGWSDTSKVIALTGIGLAFFTAHTIWAMSYYGLQLELTPNYDERTRLAAWGSIFAKLGYMLMGWVFAFVMLIGMLASGDPRALDGAGGLWRGVLEFVRPAVTWLSAPQAGESPITIGMRTVCWLICLGMLVFGLCPALFVRERYYQGQARRQPKTAFLESLRESFHCKPLWPLIGMTFFLLIGAAFIDGLYQYVNFYYVCEGDLLLGGKIIGIKGTLKMFIGLASIPVLTKLSERYDKRIIAVSVLSLLVLGHLANCFLLVPGHPYLQLCTAFSEAIAIPAIWMFMPAMKADVADWDEHRTGRRREGSLNSFYSWFVKAAHTVSVLFNGAALQWSGFNAKLPAQDGVVVHRMYVFYLCLPIVFWLLAITFAWFYPLGRKAALSIRSELEHRRGKI
jgi:GPH family glycoside/pentoside/hexuronide:cation symporter